MSTVRKIIEAGFDLKTDGTRLAVSPADKLSDEQRQFIREHKAEIMAELQTATVYDLDRHAAEKEAAIKYWRFRHNDTEVDIAGGATLAEAYDILGCGSDDVLEPTIGFDSDEKPARCADTIPGWQETKIRLWLRHIGENDPDVVTETILKCHSDMEARQFFLDRAAKALLPATVQCADCEHYNPDPIGHGGIGSCKVGGPPRGTMPAYPNAVRLCDDFKQNEVKK